MFIKFPFFIHLGVFRFDFTNVFQHVGDNFIRVVQYIQICLVHF